jgi:hypothetical protein
MLLSGKSKSQSVKNTINRHFVLIEAPIDKVGPQVILWGEAPWWPKGSAMKFVRKTEGDLQVGSKLEQRVILKNPILKLFAPHWEVEVSRLMPPKCIERTFLNGPFIGKEIVEVEERYNGARVNYQMEYQIQKWWDMFLWKMIFEKLHNRNINMILQALKSHVELEEQRKFDQ